VIEIHPSERDSVPAEEVAEILHVGRVPPADERDAVLSAGGGFAHVAKLDG
jgi:hypothetical protein